MTAKKVSVRDKRLRWKFEDGSTGLIPLVDHEAQLQAQYHAMATSDEPSLRIAGRKLLQRAAEQAAAAQMAKMQRVNASRSVRPRGKSAMKERIQLAMRQHKVGGTEFKTFMQVWEREAIDGLRLIVGELYAVDDENDDRRAFYTWNSLRKLYTTC